jgi:hypothetical protein
VLHAGLVILIPVVNHVVQRQLFKAALDEFATIGEPVNRVLEVDLDGGEVRLTLYDLPSTGSYRIPRHVSEINRAAEMPGRSTPFPLPRASGSAAAVFGVAAGALFITEG